MHLICAAVPIPVSYTHLRDCSLVTCLGLFYSWKEQIDIRNDQRTSCADAEVEQVVETIRRKTSTQDEEGGFTKKLKSILLNDR